MKKVLWLVLASFLFFACDTGGTTPEGPKDPSLIVVSSRQLQDNAGTVLGYVVDVTTHEGVLFLTSENYLVKMEWDGSMNYSSISFTGLNGAGTVFYGQSKGTAMYGKSVFHFNGTLYAPRDISTTDGTAAADTTITQYQSKVEYPGTIQNVTPAGTIDAWTTPVPLKIVTRTEIGLPDTINLPLKLVPLK